MKKQTCPLIRITLTAIRKESTHAAAITGSLDKLPLSSRVLKEAVESFENFAMRKIQIALEFYHQESIVPTMAQLLDRASMSYPTKYSRVREFIERVTQPPSG